jgi:hypothetical protein
MAKEKRRFMKCRHEDRIPGLLLEYKQRGQHVEEDCGIGGTTNSEYCPWDILNVIDFSRIPRFSNTLNFESCDISKPSSDFLYV